MKLSRVEVRNYRSFFSAGEEESTFAVDLADGMNTLVGPNNCGKSNVLRAVALAMDPGHPFERSSDMPAQMAWAFPRVVLHFESDGATSSEKTLLKYAAEYERSARGGRSRPYADDGELRFVVTYTGDRASGGARQEFFLARGAGNQQGETDKRERLLRQFRKTARFIYVQSGESLEGLLTGRFRAILELVIRDHLGPEIVQAERRRTRYVEGLQKDIFEPLRERVGEVVCQLFPEISGVVLTPQVPGVDATLSDVDVRLTDSAETSLASKGTGVRGAVMVAMLRYVAEQTRRSMIFAVEEPEAFLHPGAQESLRDDLERLGERKDVTLLVTTHSPFVVSRDPRARVIALQKEPSGRTVVGGTAAGSEPHASLLGGLFRDAALPDLLDRVAQLPHAARGVLVVEGMTDHHYLEIAAHAVDRPDLLDGVHVAPAGGASKVVVQSVLQRSQTKRPVRALLDYDTLGKAAAAQLTGTFGWQNGTDVLSYRKYYGAGEGDVEAEDLWPVPLVDQFVAEYGQDVVLAEKTRRPGAAPTWHIGFTQVGKELFPRWLRAHVAPRDCKKWIDLLIGARSSMGLDKNED